MNDEQRFGIANTFGTHLLHEGLHKVAGSQKPGGSMVDVNQLRFDFSCEQLLERVGPNIDVSINATNLIL